MDHAADGDYSIMNGATSEARMVHGETVAAEKGHGTDSIPPHASILVSPSAATPAGTAQSIGPQSHDQGSLPVPSTVSGGATFRAKILLYLQDHVMNSAIWRTRWSESPPTPWYRLAGKHPVLYMLPTVALVLGVFMIGFGWWLFSENECHYIWSTLGSSEEPGSRPADECKSLSQRDRMDVGAVMVGFGAAISLCGVFFLLAPIVLAHIRPALLSLCARCLLAMLSVFSTLLVILFCVFMPCCFCFCCPSCFGVSGGVWTTQWLMNAVNNWRDEEWTISSLPQAEPVHIAVHV